MKGNNTVKSVVKAMKVFEKLVEKGSPMSLSSISKKVDLNISTVHRLINTLLELGYVKQDDKGHYGLGLHSYKLADISSEEFDLKQLVHPYLEQIVDSCNETCNLVIMEDFQVVYIDQVESTNMVRMFASEGSRGAAYCTGSGKVLLAHLKEKKLQEYIETTDFEKFTDNTITDPAQLKLELKKIKNQGYALDLEEKERGVRCVAAPFFGEDDKLMGAISVSGPCSRIARDYLEEALIPLIKEKANEITHELQGKIYI